MDAPKAGLLILPLSVKDLKNGTLPGTITLTRQRQACIGSVQSGIFCGLFLGIVFKGGKAVRDLSEGLDDGLAVRVERGVEEIDRTAPPGAKGMSRAPSTVSLSTMKTSVSSACSAPRR